MRRRVDVGHKQLYYAAEDGIVFRIWKDISKTEEYELISALDLSIKLSVYRGAGIPCFNAASMYNPCGRIRKERCKHAV